MPRSIKLRGPTIATRHLDFQPCTIAMDAVTLAVTNPALTDTSALTTTNHMCHQPHVGMHPLRTVAAEATTAAASES